MNGTRLGTGATSSRESRPNILVIVMDCVRASEFSVGARTMSAMPFSSALGRQSIEFRRAVSPGSWTIPSHASLFTGQYPWDHRLHSRGSSPLPRAAPSLAAALGAAGYRTASFSSNPLINDVSGLTTGFQSAAWGGWWERYARHLRVIRPPGGRDVAARTPKGLAIVRKSRMWPATLSASRVALRHPLLLHSGNRFLHSLFAGPNECPSCVSPWIEGSLRTWLAAQPRTDPVFAFVNLMEAHEPYMLPPSFPDWSARWKALTLRQDFGDWLEGRWSPSPDELRVLSELYTNSIQAVDHRLRAIVEEFRRTDRWDSTVLVLTSDHGQGLGEDGVLSHGMSVTDPITRIPLWLRLPHDELGGTSTDSWASLIDVAPTLLSLAGSGPAVAGTGVDLRTLRTAGRSGPVWSMAEGLVWPGSRSRLEPDRLRRFDRVRIAGYFGDTKVSCDSSGEIASVRTLSPSDRAAPVSEVTVAEMVRGMREHLQHLESIGVISGAPGSDAAARLEGWGYV